TGTIAPPATLLNSDKAWSLNLIVKALNATVTLDGSVKDIKTPRGIDFGFRIKARNLTKLSQLVGKTLPLKEPFEMAFRATDIGLKAYRLSDFKATLGRSDISGSIDVNLVKKTPLITAKLLSKKIDLRPYLPAFGNSSSSDPLLFGALKHAEGTVKIQADRLLLLRVALNHLTAKITLKGGRLTIRPIKAAIGGGKFNGRLTIKPRRKDATVTTQLKIEDCNLGYMLKGLNITDTLEGNLNANINLKGQGRSVATLIASLDGSTNIQINQGRINNKYINLLGADLSAGVFSMLDPKKEKVDYTKINCLVSRFEIKKGLAVSTVTVFDTNSMSVFGEGEINLKTKKIDFALHPIPKDGIGFRGIGKLSLSLSGLSDSFKLGGTLAEPSLTLNPTGSAATLGKAIGGLV
ncbi:MAG: AsmA family protein, partial [Deltaproteobacteria bacterium]|nr:AsmA family protein [Deltaproteobacteria bacterium]